MYLWVASQIIIEMFPISSSGHLTLLELWLQKNVGFDIHKIFENPAHLKAVYYFLHGPTLVLITLYFFSGWWQLFFKSGIAWGMIGCVILADIITTIVYFGLKKYQLRFPLGLGFCITALALFFTAGCTGIKPLSSFSFSDAAILGLAQGFAVFPGISRLAFTCSVGCLLGFSLYDSFFISWTIQAPLMAAACIKSLKDLHQPAVRRQVLNLPMGLVMLGSSGISFLALYAVAYMAQQANWYWFGFYMLIPLMIGIYLNTKNDPSIQNL